MELSEDGINLIKSFEGFSPVVYFDSAGLPTIGYGTLIDKENEEWLLKASINETTATQLMKTDLRTFESCVNKLVTSKINQYQFDALVSFTYNLGCGALKRSSLLRMVNRFPNSQLIRECFLKWVNVNGVPNAGLKNRRSKEAVYYMTK